MAKLKPRARIIRTIGDKLISGPEAAIIELVKNSYDADSPYVNITFIPPKYKNYVNSNSPVEEEGSITISDNGHGMTKSDLENIWLEPATDEKTQNRKSRSGKRTVLGAKGVGRFATASLGNSIELTTIAEQNGELKKCQLSLDWDIFEKAKYLEEIDIEIKELPIVDGDKTGVTIQVIGLKNIWGQERLRSLIQELRKLATPQNQELTPFTIKLDLKKYKLSSQKKEYQQKLKSAKNRDDVDKQVFSPYDFDGIELLKENNKDLNTLIAEQSQDISEQVDGGNINPYSLGDHCHYMVKGTFDSKGEFIGTFHIVRGDNKEQVVLLPPPPLLEGEHSCGELDVYLRIFDLESDSVKDLIQNMGLNYAKFTLRKARDFISEGTGVGIFRNDFRIRPYGHHAHDWLKLEKRRVQNPSVRIGHNQLAGEIDVQNEWTSMLVERSSREGLEENGAFFRLKSLINNLLLHVEAERHTFREKAGISRKPKKNYKEAIQLASLEKVKSAINSVQALAPKDRKTIEVEIDKTSAELEKILKGMNEYMQILESRATLGNVIAELLHEGRGYLSSIAGTKDFLKEYGSHLTENNELGEIARSDLPLEITNLVDGHSGINKLFKDLDPISGRKRGKSSYHKVLDVAERVERLTKSARNEAEVFVKYSVDKELTFFGFDSDLQAALMNLFLNAIHWLDTVEREEKYISIVASKVDESLAIQIINNGPEINELHIDKLFEAGFTLKSKGHGLGLSIAKEAIINSGGSLCYDREKQLTTFEIILPMKAVE